MKKFTGRYNNIITLKNLLRAWEAFLRGKKKKNDVALFQAKLLDNTSNLQQDILDKTYVHGSYRSFNISDPKPRNIHKATVRDRLLHHLLYQELNSYFDEIFIHDSYSCRVNKGTHRALDRFRAFGRKVSRNNTRTCWVLKCDIKKFFANIDHEILKKILARHIEDGEILWLLGRVIDSFHTEGKPGIGLPLGNLISQLLVNVYMNEFDQFVKHTLRASHYIRYADDFVFMSDEKVRLENLLPRIETFLAKRLRLVLHPDKVFIQTLASGVDFLGWVHFPDHRVLRTATKRRMFNRLHAFPKPEAIQSYLGLLKHGNAKKLRGSILEQFGKLL